MKKFYRFILFVNLLILIWFLVFFFRTEISTFISNQTGTDFEIPAPNLEWVAFWKKDEEKVEEDTASAENKGVFIELATDDDKEQSNQDEQVGQGEDVFESRINNLEGNTVIGINYSAVDDSPQALSSYADRIVEAKIKSVQVESYDNVVRSELVAKVKHTYKGVDADEIKLHAFGGTLKKDDLKSGQVKMASTKTDDTGDTVNVLMDFCEPIEDGETYIIFMKNNNGILTPACGNMSFFKVDGGDVIRLSSDDKKFVMKKSDFEKEFLEKYK